MIPLNYHHLYYFYITAKSGSITKACDILLLSQPAVSTQLKSLEKSLGSPLFERRKQRLFLTDVGRFVLDYAESIFEIGKELTESLKGKTKDLRPIFRVGILSGTPRAFGHTMLKCVYDKFPGAHITVWEGQMADLTLELSEQRLDLLLSDTSIRSDDRQALSNHLVGKVPIVFAAAPKLAKLHKRVPADLPGAPFILPSWNSHVARQLANLLAEWRVEPRIVAEVQDAELARNLAVAGLGIAPLNAYTVSINLPRNSLTVLDMSRRLTLYESLYLVSRYRKWPNPIIDHLIKNLRLPTMRR